MTTYAHLRAPQAVERPELVRREPRVFAGVARGLSMHLGGDVRVWRAGFAGAALLLGLGLVTYLVLAVAIPREAKADAARSRVAPTLAEREVAVRANRRGERRPLITIAIILALAGLALFFMVLGVGGRTGANLIPILVILAGAGIAWSHPLEGENASVGLTVTGGFIAALGALGLAAAQLGWSSAFSGVMTGVIVLGVLALVLVPVLVQNRTRLQEEQEARIREAERANIAAHLHDSVLQTLALIRSRAHEPEEVASLARAQERDLRRYLYSDRSEEGGSVAEQLRAGAAEIEELFRTEIDAVITGDMVPSIASRALVGATREALTNACKHGGSDRVSLYAELGEECCNVFVRDRGEGFDQDAVPDDRAGIRDSICGRLETVGGSVLIRSPLATGGTEVHMRIEGEQ